MESEDLVSVYTVQSATEAEIVRNSLKSAGIDCEIGGEIQAGLTGVLAIDILTHVSDADRARKHLRQVRKDKKERHKRRVEAKKAKEAGSTAAPTSSEAIQELKPPLPSTDITKKKKKRPEGGAES
jgi:hypothetical protein